MVRISVVNEIARSMGMFRWLEEFVGTGHRYDSIPFVNGMIESGMSCQLLLVHTWQGHAARVASSAACCNLSLQFS